MGIPHKAFDFKRIVLCITAFVLFFTQNQAHAEENPLFVVEGVNVDVTAENSVAAQQKAFDQAQIKAFETLAQRVAQSSGGKPVPTPGLMTISPMIKDFEVTNEQVSAVRYVGTYTFRFRPADVTQYFSLTNLNYTPQVATGTLMVLPFFQQGEKISIWGDNNLWLAAWSRAKLPTAQRSVEVPIGDLMDVGDINDSLGLSYDVNRLSDMQHRYGSTESAVMVANPDDALEKVPGDADKAFGKLQISIYHTDGGKPQFVKDMFVEADRTETRAQLYDRAVLSAYQALQADWKNKDVVNLADAKGYDVKIPIKNLQDWVRIQKILNNLPGMGAVLVTSLSPREARASLNFNGDEAHLRDTLTQYGMGLSAGIPDGAGVPFYELSVDVPNPGESFYKPPVDAADVPQQQHETRDNTFYQAPASESAPAQEPAAGDAGDDMVHTF